jgi:hypothetical protein
MLTARSRWVLSGWLLLGLGLHSGCATWRMGITLQGDADTNGGRPLQVLVRTLSLPAYRSEPYGAISQLSLTPDNSVVRALTVDPRERFRQRLYVRVPSSSPVAIYFLYTSQTGSWKMILQPPLPWSVRIPLGRRGVQVDQVSECRFLRADP